ncbi:MAG TPA: condensation domain-containing protein, partial [Burkholderiaceae bacterium]
YLEQSKLRLVVVGGEKVSLESYRKWKQIAKPHQAWINSYGPTETTVMSSAYSQLDDRGQQSNPTRVPIGRPIGNTQIYILDAMQQPVPLGVSGEIHIGGTGVTRGYRNRPGLTAERFIADPFSGTPGARMYRTGDLGCFRPDGHIEYLGRNDHQVKIRGFRIELGEIESQLSRHPSIRETVVIAREDVPGERRLVAYLTQNGEAAASTDELRTSLRESLPDYMVPSAFVVLDALPLTPNGKLDRKALPAPEQGAYVSQSYEAPQGEIEEILAGIWQELLRVECIGRHDNFFDLGGHSLLAVQLMTRIRQGLGREMALRQLFEHPTVAALARQLMRTGSIAVAAIGRADRTQALPLSWPQQRLWFVDQMEDGGTAYNMSNALRMVGELDRAALQAALDTLVERHEVLRTIFVADEGKAVQLVQDPGRFDIVQVDLDDLPATAREEQVRRHTAEEVGAPFDLETGPLIRARLLKVNDQEHVLLLTMHHIVSDGWSMGIVMRELAVLYAAYREGKASPLAPLSLQYADYAVWQRQWLQGDLLQSQLDYWKAHLAGAPALLGLPADRARPAQQSYRGGVAVFAIDAELTLKLRKLAREHHATMFMTIYTAFAILLSRLSGQDDVVIGTPVANRLRTEVEGLIGFFVNTLALRARLDGNPTVRNMLQQVKAMTLDAYSHQDVPFEQVVDVVQPPRSLSHSPLFQAMLVLQNTPEGEFSLPGLKLMQQETPHNTETFDLTLALQERGDRVFGAFSYACDLFDQARIERWIGHFQAVLGAMAQDAEQRVNAIELLDDKERSRLIDEISTTGAAYPAGKPVHAWIEEQVERNPEAVALVYGEATLSYAELNRRANQLAHHL